MIRYLCFIACVLYSSQSVASQIGVVESWQFVSGIQDTYVGINQVYETTDVLQSPLQTHQQLNYHQSYSAAFINAVIADQNLVLVIQPEQHCERTETSLPSCLTLGNILLIPSVDLVLNFQGSYDYYLSGNPLSGSAYMKVTKMTAAGNVGPVVASQSFVYDSDGTLEFDRTVILEAGNRYWLKYSLLSHASYSELEPGSFVNGFGTLTIETHPVPETSMLFALGLGAIMILRVYKSEEHFP